MAVSLTYGLIAALGYAIAAILSKRALAEGAGVMRVAFVANLLFVAVFGCYLLGDWSGFSLKQIHLPMICGGLFFLGQLFTFASIRVGDVSVQTPIMGTKVMFVVLIGLALGTEAPSSKLMLVASAVMVAVAMLGFSDKLLSGNALAICLSLLSACFFGGYDVMVGNFSLEYGVGSFLFIAVAVNAILSLALIPFFNQPLKKLTPVAWKWAILAGLGMALQALIFNYALANYQQVATMNIAYSTRGLWSVLLATPAAYLLAGAREKITPRTRGLRFGGAALMTVSMLIWFS
ncbi:hypothetical protein [Coraliomargarita parva]|uniref:hypothetical protein n=1 Tax=Coraliomargarita parva TaxID=3014050 RepID=UPI0022B3D8BE|nr:hypothetical protein [Coraliomargarita parva]